MPDVRRSMQRLSIVFTLLLSTLTSAPAARAADSCADLSSQVQQLDQRVDQARLALRPMLDQASQMAISLPAELLAAAAAGDDPALTPELAQTDAALAASVGASIGLVAANADNQDAAGFVTQLAQSVPQWQAQLAPLQATAVPSVQALNAMLQNVGATAGEAQLYVAARDGLQQALGTCQQAAGGPTMGCGLDYDGLDRSGPRPTLRAAVPGLRQDVAVGAEWEDASTSQTGDGTVDTVDTYRCVGDGVTKVGRVAVQSFADGTTAVWGESDYTGTLWPKSIAPGASWQWHAVQFSGAYAETWDVTVKDVGREPLTLDQGRFEAIHLQLEEDISKPDGQSDHFTWDEWYARPLQVGS